MPAPLAHITIGFSLYRIIRYRFPATRIISVFGHPWVLLLACLFFSLLPDADSALGILLQDFGRYHNQWSHSLFTGIVPSLLLAGWVALVRKRGALEWGLLCFFSYDLHVLLDFFCYGRGVKLFWPLTSERFISPVLLFYGVRWSDGFVSHHHIATLINELLFAMIVLPPLLYLTRKQD